MADHHRGARTALRWGLNKAHQAAAEGAFEDERLRSVHRAIVARWPTCQNPSISERQESYNGEMSDPNSAEAPKSLETAATDVAAADYGSPTAELEALRHGAGLIDRSWADVIELCGADRHRFLGSQMTSDVAALEAGQAQYGLFVSGKGRVVADAVVLAMADRLLIELPTGCAAPIGDRLTKYIIVDQVEVNIQSSWRALSLTGPRAAQCLAEKLSGELPAEPWSLRAASLAGHELWIAHQPLFRQPAYTLWVQSSSAEILTLLADQEGITRVGRTAYEAHRIDHGWPAFGQDYEANCFPQECGLDGDGVSYTKGCYLGQEVVARIHYRGGVQRRLCQLQLDGVDRAAIGRELLLEGRAVGRLTSQAELPEGNLGLAIVHRRAAAGSQLEVDGGGTARVVELAAADH